MELILAFASLFAAVIPMFTYLLVIWWMDRNEREPFWIMLLNFFWGATGAFILAIIGSVIFEIPLSVFLYMFSGGEPGQLMDLSGAIITAPLVEEFTKGIFLVIMANMKRFDGIVDGVVYGGAIGLGFGMTENFMYFLSYGQTPADWIFIVIIRTLFSAVMHCMSQATLGAFVGFAKFKPAILKIIIIPAGYFIAVLIHFTWNLTVSFEDTSLLGMLFLVLYFFSLFAVFQIALYLESRTITRFKAGWCPGAINQKDYVRSSIQLALRKHQYKNSYGVLKQYYQRDVENLRYKIQMMFYNASK